MDDTKWIMPWKKPWEKVGGLDRALCLKEIRLKFKGWALEEDLN